MKHNLFHLCDETQTRQNPITAASVSKFSRVFKCSLHRRHLRIHSRSDFLHIYRVLNLVTYRFGLALGAECLTVYFYDFDSQCHPVYGYGELILLPVKFVLLFQGVEAHNFKLKKETSENPPDAYELLESNPKKVGILTSTHSLRTEPWCWTCSFKVITNRAFSLVLELCTSPPLAHGFLGGERVLDSS
ncbi:hypothetical protein QL285_033246 [Trifolium repens]|nr:hypothetical protein QL285_033246 [Trifolium repens]